MNTLRITDQTLSAINHYEHFKVGSATCNIPYFNNRRTGLRAALPALVGKGSPKQIFEEIEIETLQEKIPLVSFTDQSLKQYLIDKNIGIDCSGFAYFILNEESIARKKGSLDRHLSFPFAAWLMPKITARLQPQKNTDVRTFAHNKNSSAVDLSKAQPGDMITMTNPTSELNVRDHILVIHQIEYQNFIPTVLHYVNSVAWPSDGLTGHGVREGVIEILDITKPLSDQLWTEAGATGSAHYTHARAKISQTDIRRLHAFN